MTADINIFTADSKLRFPFPREVRFNRSAHSAVPTSMNGWEDDFRIGKFGSKHLFVVWYVLSISKNYCVPDGTETLLEIWELLLGGNRSRWLSKVKLCTTVRDCTLQRKSVCGQSAHNLIIGGRISMSHKNSISMLCWQIMYATHRQCVLST